MMSVYNQLSVVSYKPLPPAEVYPAALTAVIGLAISPPACPVVRRPIEEGIAPLPLAAVPGILAVCK